MTGIFFYIARGCHEDLPAHTMELIEVLLVEVYHVLLSIFIVDLSNYHWIPTWIIFGALYKAISLLVVHITER